MLLHYFCELLEQIGAVLRTRSALGVVLHRENPVGDTLHALGRAVEQVDVRQRKPRAGERIDIHGVAVVLARDFEFSRHEVLHRVVGTAVSELHLEGPGAVGQRNQLVTHADSEDGQFAAELLHQFDHRRHVLGVAGSVRKHQSVGMKGHDLLHGGVIRHDGHVAPYAVQQTDDVVLDTAVNGHDVVLVVGDTRHPALAAAHARNHVVRRDVFTQFAHGLLAGSRNVGDEHLLCSFVADDARQGTGVHAPDSRNVVLLEDFVERLRITEIRRRVVVLAHDHAADGRRFGLVVLVGHTVVADQRVGHHDHLIRVRRIGHDLLIPHHRGIEDDLVDGLAVGTETVSVELAAVLQDNFFRKCFHPYLFDS